MVYVLSSETNGYLEAMHRLLEARELVLNSLSKKYSDASVNAMATTFNELLDKCIEEDINLLRINIEDNICTGLTDSTGTI